MFSIIFATQIHTCDTTNQWICLYEEYKEILKESLEKMTGVNLKELFKSSEIQNKDFNNALNNIKKLRNEHEKRINKILERCVRICVPEDPFSVYFIPLPFNFVIVTNYSPKIGTFILYGANDEISSDALKIYLPHEYAHIVRLQKILLPKNIDSPYKMTLGELAIFEGLGVVFSMVLNDEISEKNIPKYAGLKSTAIFEKRVSLISEFMKLKYKKISELPMDVFQKYYSNETKALYIVGASLVFDLVSAGYSICNLNKMKTEEIMRLINENCSVT